MKKNYKYGFFDILISFLLVPFILFLKNDFVVKTNPTNNVVAYTINNNNAEEIIKYVYEYDIDYLNSNLISTNPYFGSFSALTSDNSFIYGSDDRVIVDNTRIYPYRSICKIEVSYDEEPNKIYLGTGFLVGPSTILTACHVVFHETYGFFNKIYFSFGTYYDNVGKDIVLPYGKINSWNTVTCGNYFDTDNFNDDWALIDLNTNIGNELGYFGVSSTILQEGDSVSLLGYHGDLNGNLAAGRGTAFDIYDYSFYHTCDTVGGSSGGPLVRNNIAVGIQHGYFNNGYSAIACKISSYIVQWITQRIEGEM